MRTGSVALTVTQLLRHSLCVTRLERNSRLKRGQQIQAGGLQSVYRTFGLQHPWPHETPPPPQPLHAGPARAVQPALAHAL